MQKNGVDAKNFEYRVAKNDKPYFILKAANHQEIGVANIILLKAASPEKGVESVMNNASSAVIKEVTE